MKFGEAQANFHAENVSEKKDWESLFEKEHRIWCLLSGSFKENGRKKILTYTLPMLI